VTAAVLLVVAAVFKTSDLLDVLGLDTRVPSSNKKETTGRRRLQRARVVGDNGEGQWPLGICEGDCDSDEDCEDGLTCFQRGPGDPIPGCTDAPSHGADFCIDTTSSSTTSEKVRNSRNSNGDDVRASIVGNDDDSWFPLGLCQGDCDSDDDCQDGLYCFQRNAGEDIPGCRGIPDTASDFCVGQEDAGAGEEEERDESESFLLKMYWEEGMWFVAISKNYLCLTLTYALLLITRKDISGKKTQPKSGGV